MKKNTMMRLASVLLICVLLTTSTISGTFAKYVPDGSAKESARVAKWGVDFTITSDLFDASYATDDEDFTKMSLSVKSDDDKNVVAPGTKGDGFTFVTNGVEPEVSYQVTFQQTDGTTPETVFLAAESYYPVKFTVSFNSVNTVYDTIDAALAAISKTTYYFNVVDKHYYTSTDNGATWSATGLTDAPTLALSWAWDFDDNGNGTYDALDTKLGNLAAGIIPTGFVDGTDYNLDIAFDITVTATQID